MGEAARKLTGRQTTAARPHLRLVKSRPHRAPARRRRRGDAALAFRAFCAVIGVLALVGSARVTLAVQAQEAAIDANVLRSVIKTELQVSKTLEADRSALAAPSRIESIASASLNMAQPAEVCYINLPDSGSAGASSGDDAGTDGSVVPNGDTEPSRVSEVISTMMDVAVGEAQVLLVGDVGIASAK